MECNSIQQEDSDTRHQSGSHPYRFRPRSVYNSIRERPSSPLPLRNCALPARPDQNFLIGATHGARRWTIQALRRSGVRLEISSVLSAASVEYS